MWKIVLCLITTYFIGFHLVNVSIPTYMYTHTHICIYTYFYNNNDKNDNILLSLNAHFIHQIFSLIVWVASKNVIHAKTSSFAITEDFHRNVMQSLRTISVESLSINGLRIELPSRPTWTLVVKFWCIFKEKISLQCARAAIVVTLSSFSYDSIDLQSLIRNFWNQMYYEI